jgi:hypothetical protein
MVDPAPSAMVAVAPVSSRSTAPSSPSPRSPRLTTDASPLFAASWHAATARVLERVVDAGQLSLLALQEWAGGIGVDRGSLRIRLRHLCEAQQLELREGGAAVAVPGFVAPAPTTIASAGEFAPAPEQSAPPRAASSLAAELLHFLGPERDRGQIARWAESRGVSRPRLRGTLRQLVDTGCVRRFGSRNNARHQRIGDGSPTLVAPPEHDAAWTREIVAFLNEWKRPREVHAWASGRGRRNIRAVRLDLRRLVGAGLVVSKGASRSKWVRSVASLQIEEEASRRHLEAAAAPLPSSADLVTSLAPGSADLGAAELVIELVPVLARLSSQDLRALTAFVDRLLSRPPTAGPAPTTAG